MSDFVVILELKVFHEGILNFSFCHFINQKILSTDRKQTHFHHVFRSEMLYNMYKPSENTLQKMIFLLSIFILFSSINV